MCSRFCCGVKMITFLSVALTVITSPLLLMLFMLIAKDVEPRISILVLLTVLFVLDVIVYKMYLAGGL